MRWVVIGRRRIPATGLVVAAVAWSVPAISAEQAKAPALIISDLQADRTAAYTPAADKLSSLKSNLVASATRRLDLHKLTMADFGDVEPLR
ncbi:MAG: hypothetical protein ABWZ86_04630 [Hyphomicrobium sp.]